MGREGNSLSGVLRDAWDGLTLAPMTKANRVRATDPHIGIVAHVTKDELLQKPDRYRGRQRIWQSLLLVCGSTIKGVAFLFQRPPIPSCTRSPRKSRKRSPVARGYGTPCVLQHPPGKPGRRSTTTFPLIVLVWREPCSVGLRRTLCAYRRCMRASMGTDSIDQVHLRAALALWQHAEASTRMIFGDSLGHPIADTILRALRTSVELTDSQVSDLFGRHLSSAKLEQAKSVLLTVGLAHCVSLETGGRPRIVWRVGAK